jgi:hypothetical protein
VLATCSLVLCLAVAELGLRLWPPIPDDQLLPFPYNVDRVRRIADGDVSLGFDKDLGWRPTPDRVRREDGAIYRVNRQGLRADREYAPEPPEGMRRIAAFGDSFTYCAEVTQDDCWVARLDTSWPHAELVNFGVPGYGPDQAWLRYQRDGRSLHPCGVLIGYYVEDIDRVVNRFRPFIDPADSVVLSKPRYLLDGDGLALLPNPTSKPMDLGDPRVVEETLGSHDAWYFPGVFVPGPFDGSSLVRLGKTAAYRASRMSLLRTPDTYPLYEQQGEAYQVTGRVLIQFAQQVRADGSTPIVVVFPGQRDLRSEPNGQPAYAPLVNWVERAGVSVVDLPDLMLSAREQYGIDRLFGVTHYSSLGNRIVARYLEEALPDLLAPTCPPT